MGWNGRYVVQHYNCLYVFFFYSFIDEINVWDKNNAYVLRLSIVFCYNRGNHGGDFNLTTRC